VIASSLLLSALLTSSAAPAKEPAHAFAPRCGGEAVAAEVVEVVRQEAGELQVVWELDDRPALWGYALPPSPAIAGYRAWLAEAASQPGAPVELGAAERAINDAVARGRFGLLRPMRCLEAALLERQLAATGPAALREFVAYVLRRDAPSRVRIYWLSGPNELPPRDDVMRPRLLEALDAGWRIAVVVHPHTGRHPVAAPSASDAQYGAAWARRGAERFVVLGGEVAFDVSGTELLAFEGGKEPAVPALSDAEARRASEVLHDYAAAWRANDRAALLGLLDDDVVLMPAGLQPIVGREAAEAFWFPDDGSTTTITAFEMRIDEVDGAGDLAWVRARSEFTFLYEEGGRSATQTSRTMSLTLLRRRAGGEWKIARRIWGPLGGEPD